MWVGLSRMPREMTPTIAPISEGSGAPISNPSRFLLASLFSTVSLLSRSALS